MNQKQSTLKKAFTVSGTGLHTGKTVNMTFLPADVNYGYKFQRVDMENQPIIDADVDNVVDVSRGTTLEQNGAKVYTVEHVLAALVGMEVDNVLVQMDAEETAIMDGSSRPFVEKIEEVGILDQGEDRNFFEIPENVHFTDEENGVDIVAMPLDDYRLTVMVDYNSPVLGSQHASVTDLREFKSEIASCRTFVFLHELEMLLKNNLIKGGDLNNAIVVVDRVVESSELDHLASLFNKPRVEVKKEGILNNVELRFQNEPARHKLLDMIGDLALVGRPIKAQVMAARPGHASNVAFAKKIKSLIKKSEKEIKNKAPEYNPNVAPLFDNKQVSEFLPHKFPFLLVDKILSKTETEIVAVKNVTADQYFFQGHFPGNPIMPGVLQLEAMAQAGGVLILSEVEDPEHWSTYFVKIENAKFKEKVVPGDTLVLKMKLMAPIRRGLCLMQGKAYVGEKLVCEADMMAQIVKDKI
jgi:UDP-3-O-[3-hydroxymyristoyl] N-acetylglucosamine deacetylase/3-hydroxyacyl-[acyl-carrier-protein] dehydratase